MKIRANRSQVLGQWVAHHRYSWVAVTLLIQQGAPTFSTVSGLFLLLCKAVDNHCHYMYGLFFSPQ